ncbi:hypothetical protein V8C43DRAFT_279200 [Trichoderma afarasin]
MMMLSGSNVCFVFWLYCCSLMWHSNSRPLQNDVGVHWKKEMSQTCHALLTRPCEQERRNELSNEKAKNGDEMRQGLNYIRRYG